MGGGQISTCCRHKLRGRSAFSSRFGAAKEGLRHEGGGLALPGHGCVLGGQREAGETERAEEKE